MFLSSGLKTFGGGGIHPTGYKHLTNTKPLKNAPIPSIAIIPLHQHMGSPAECVVNVGDTIKEGMLVGRATGFFSSNIHSSIPGKVTNIIDFHLPNGVKSKAIIIELAGTFDRSGKPEPPKRDWLVMTNKEMLNKIFDLGVVGLGGATFPTHVKYNFSKGKEPEYLIINGVECEPFLTSDHRLMLEKSKEILTGIQVLQKIAKPKKTIIAIEANKADAADAMRKVITGQGLDNKIEVTVLKVRYPQGDEKQLIKALINKEIPTGKLPLDVGAIVSNVGTVFAVYEAVVLDKPLIDRFVTVSGRAIRRPGNFKVRIGTPIRDLIEECGGFTELPGKIVAGGPLMGYTLVEINTPVTKGISGVIAFTQAEARNKYQTNCIQCGKCIAVCPFGLMPTILYKQIEHQAYAEAIAHGLLDCKECGCCGYICPARIPLVQGLKLGKSISRNQKEKVNVIRN